MHALTQLDLSGLRTLVFAGGGNRCWWQAGLVQTWLAQGFKLPGHVVGTSAGAAIATACLIPQGTSTALQACTALYGQEQRIFDWRGLAQLRPRLRFAHQHVYPAWLAEFVDEHGLAAVRASGARLTVAVTRPARVLGLAGSVAVGTLAYVVDKHLRHSIHPRLPRWLGLRQDFVDLQDCTHAEDARRTLCAAAAAPPFMSAVRLDPGVAFDGGYTDNAPIPMQDADEKARTLVLLTRHYPGLPKLFRFAGRAYLQPSRPVPVSTWDCTARATVREAFALGEADGQLLFASGSVSQVGAS